MRKMITAAAVMMAIFALAAPSVMAGNVKGSQDGSFFKYFYQWLRDDDGDGIPNCLDPDYVRPEDGTGYGKLGPSLSGDQFGVTIRDRDRLRDGSCGASCAGKLYKHAKGQGPSI